MKTQLSSGVIVRRELRYTPSHVNHLHTRTLTELTTDHLHTGSTIPVTGVV